VLDTPHNVRYLYNMNGDTKKGNDMETAKIISEQMGGINKMMAMAGAKNFVDHGDALSFKFKACKKYNYCKVTLDEGLDLYNVTFSKVDKWGAQTNEKNIAAVYADQLKKVFESETGLYLSL